MNHTWVVLKGTTITHSARQIQRLQHPWYQTERRKTKSSKFGPIQSEDINSHSIWIWSPRHIWFQLCIHSRSKQINITSTKLPHNTLEKSLIQPPFNLMSIYSWFTFCFYVSRPRNMNSWYKVMSLQTSQPNVSCYVITSWFSTPFIVIHATVVLLSDWSCIYASKFIFAQWLQSKQSCFKLKTVDMVRGLIGCPHTSSSST